MKIFIIGQSGSGKTYFSKKIAEQTDIEHVEMDQINKDVKYNLTKFYEKLNKYLDENSEWIIDGKYKRVRKRLIKEADIIVFLDLPFYISVYRNIAREFKTNKMISIRFIKHLVKVIREFNTVRTQIYNELFGHECKLNILKSRAEVSKFLQNFS